METIEKSMDDLLKEYLNPIEENWQPSDFLPDSRDDDFIDKVKEIKELSRELSYDLVVVLIGDTITEEALPSYESWLMNVEGVDQDANNGWSKWVRAWSSEENRHGDLLNKYLYMCGRVDMRQMEISTQYLITDGFDIGTGFDPYRNFIYTSFQELATNISHKRVSSLVRKAGNEDLAKICSVIAADEARHAGAYMNFVSRIIELDASELLVALEDMMRKKIVMPAHLLREKGQGPGDLFDVFSDAAQRLNVYTTQDYINILKYLLRAWKIGNLSSLTDDAERARDYLMKLPARLQRISERVKIPEESYNFSWVG
jgi:acyl-[acyl-carrier-protein] desaturase